MSLWLALGGGRASPPVSLRSFLSIADGEGEGVGTCPSLLLGSSRSTSVERGVVLPAVAFLSLQG